MLSLRPSLSLNSTNLFSILFYIPDDSAWKFFAKIANRYAENQAADKMCLDFFRHGVADCLRG